FVAHRVEQSIVVPLYGFELDLLSKGEVSKRLEAAAAITARILVHAVAQHSNDRRYFYSGRPRTIHVPALAREEALRECAKDSSDKDAKKSSSRAPEPGESSIAFRGEPA